MCWPILYFIDISLTNNLYVKMFMCYFQNSCGHSPKLSSSMAEAQPNSGFNEATNLICGICLELYDDPERLPKFLNCHHNYFIDISLTNNLYVKMFMCYFQNSCGHSPKLSSSMAEAQPNSGFNEATNLICGICLELYDDPERLPKFLNCHHSFCVHCLQVSTRQCSFKRKKHI